MHSIWKKRSDFLCLCLIISICLFVPSLSLSLCLPPIRYSFIFLVIFPLFLFCCMSSLYCFLSLIIVSPFLLFPMSYSILSFFLSCSFPSYTILIFLLYIFEIGLFLSCNYFSFSRNGFFLTF